MPTANEKIQQALADHSVDFDHFTTGVVRRMIRLLDRVDPDLIAQVQAALERLPAESFTVERLESLLSSVRALNAQAYQALITALQGELQQTVSHESAYQASLFRKAIPSAVQVEFQVATVVAEQVYAAAMARPFQGRLLREWAQSLEASRMARVRDAIRIGYVENQTIAQIVQRIRGTRANKYADGLLEIDRRSAQAVVRTAVGHVAGFARERFYQANEDLIGAILWRATLDKRTSETCFPGSTFPLPAGDFRGITRRQWDGDLVVITTSSGKKLRATPNHPVLTARGWRPIKELSPGNDVLYRIVGDVGKVAASEDVEMPATFSAIFDALKEPAFGDIASERSTEADFHGDGTRGDYEVHYPRSESHLRLAFDTKFGEKQSKSLFAFVASSGFLSTEGESFPVLNAQGLGNMASKVDPFPLEYGVKTRLADMHVATDVRRLDARVEHGDKTVLVWPARGLPAAKRSHDSSALENSSDRRRFDVVVAGDSASSVAIRVTADDVVALEREFFSGHVYNLSTGPEFYFADGFVVHNCRIRDGHEYTADEKHRPIGHQLPWLGGPGAAHWNCRSTGVPLLKSWRELGMNQLEGSTRASMDGQVPADLSYAEWFKKQSAERQDEIVGPTRGRLMREGKLPFDELYTPRGRYLTLAELRQRDEAAFKRAGLD